VADVKYGREKVKGKIIDKSPEDDKSNKSKSRRRKTVKAPGSAGFASINESQLLQNIDGLSGEQNLNLMS